MCPCTKAPDNYDDEDDINDNNNDDGDDADDKAGNKAEAGDEADNDNGNDDGNDNDIIIMLSPCTTELSRIDQDNDMEDQTTERGLLNGDFYKTGGR